MVSISTPTIAGGIPTIWVEDSVCQTDKNGKCKISSPKKSRQYEILVTAVDKAGNVGTSSCGTLVGDKTVAVEDPLFLIAKIEVAGNTY